MGSVKYDVIVVGELNVDLILNKIDGFPEMGKEKLADQMTLTLGSSSAIFASNLSALGARVAFIGKIGHDQFGQLTLDSLQKKGVSTEFIIQDKNLNTGATIVLNYEEDRAMITHPGAMNHLTIQDISAEQLKQARHLHFSSYFLQPGIKKDVGQLFRMARELGLTTSFDMQWDPEEKWELDAANILPYVDIFLPNRQELVYLTGQVNLKEAVHKLGANINTVVVKLGNEGSHLFDGKTKKEIRLPAFKNEQVVDAIGAGDSFNAGFIFKFIQGAPLEECQRFGNLCGAINTTAAGGTTAFRNFDQVMKIAKERFGYEEK
ncbi:PfkB domain protein [Caldithrix abyssi DSM 13497]|uniref:PfkB domain protein n=1 Tax=Caldithrix abyssi DSM 13497 TaxID=880073 RepID=H1XRF9_CALAY|nr:carbohydrate kinase family protein [Caldithrix abyssi]APF18434.1 Sugar or nucleoside kinase, ribokinase family [Caldithrix abyssi DSM 13497]EHO42440.1 PfkB domain protein [Caldithrix abyssi DSM 13497]